MSSEAMRIVINYWAKPIPLRDFDFEAVTSDYSGEPSDPIGYGATEAEATADLLDQMEPDAPPEEPDPDRLRDDRNERRRLTKECPDVE